MENTNERFEKFGNVMIDIETLSNKTNAAIVEIAAVEFNKKNGNIGETFHRKIKSDSWFDLPSRDVNADTLKWWLKQSEEARKNIYEDKADDVPIYDALSELALFIKDCDNKSHIQNDDRSVVVWSNGSVFDISILENAYNAIQSIKIPWKFWAINDVRTIVALNPEIKQNCQFEGNPHCALDDCMHQIKYLSQTLDSIMIKEPISTMETITSRP